MYQLIPKSNRYESIITLLDQFARNHTNFIAVLRHSYFYETLESIIKCSYCCTNLFCSTYKECEPGCSVSIVSGYGLDDRAIEVRSPVEAKGFFL
jgi:hypothetical protein